MIIMTIIIKILTLSGFFYQNKAKKIILPTTTGYISILENYTSFMTALDIGILSIFSEEEIYSYIIFGGFAIIKQNNVNILTNIVEVSNKLDISQYNLEFQKAKSILESAETEKQRINAIFQYKLAKARYESIQK
uniref:ATP synthase epsilon chain, chloroplastic n=1 Tax=Prototheca cutis TaxID=575411 RepID=A0A2Z6BET1_9CHLO|nr:cf1 epsilon subunit of atp synthase [Prototheca cutis]BBD20231.1 cf1 epsilon subunit of atp synthase [Prototheca cutis]